MNELNGLNSVILWFVAAFAVAAFTSIVVLCMADKGGDQ